MPFYLFLRRLRRSPAAFCGLSAIALLVLIARDLEAGLVGHAAAASLPSSSSSFAPELSDHHA